MLVAACMVNYEVSLANAKLTNREETGVLACTCVWGGSIWPHLKLYQGNKWNYYSKGQVKVMEDNKKGIHTLGLLICYGSPI